MDITGADLVFITLTVTAFFAFSPLAAFIVAVVWLVFELIAVSA